MEMEEHNIEEHEEQENKSEEKKDEDSKLQLITKESSLDSNLFINPQISDYKCIICENIPSPENAYEALCCPIIFCKSCLLRWIYQNPKCPLCKKTMHNEAKYVRNIKQNYLKNYSLHLYS